MPKSYSDTEKTKIIQKLENSAAHCMKEFGIRHTTVDVLVKLAKIPKGTFYLFYKSKEALLLEVLAKQSDSILAQMSEVINSFDPHTVTCEQLTDLVFWFFKSTEETTLLKIMMNGEVELLERKLPPEDIEKYFGNGNTIIDKVVSMIPKINKKLENYTISTSFYLIFMTMASRRELGEKYDNALKLMIRGVILQMMYFPE